MKVPAIAMTLVAACVFAPLPCLAEAPAPSAGWAALEATGSVLTLSGLDPEGLAALLNASQRLVADPERGVAVAEVLPQQASPLERLRIDRRVEGASEALFLAEAAAAFPEFIAGRGAAGGLLSKTPSVRRIPAIRPVLAEGRLRESSPEGTCLYESFEELPVWWEDNGYWYHYEYDHDNNRGDYFWLDVNCQADLGSWSASATLGGDYGQYLQCWDTYDRYTDSWMKYAYALECAAGRDSGELRFAFQVQSETGYDTFGYYASVDDIDYYGYVYSGNFASEWYQASQDLRSWYGLGDLTGYPWFALAFNFYADDVQQTGFGAYLDDIEILVGSADPPCTLTCTAAASPAAGLPPLAVQFTGAAVPSGCAGTVAYAWDFGDGGTAAVPNPTHTYTSPGTFTWTMTAAVQGVACSGTGIVTVAAPPRPLLALGNAAGPPGSTVSLPITLSGRGASVCGTFNRLSYPDASLSFVDAQIGPAAQAAGKSVAFYLNPATGAVNIAITGFNQTPIADGVVAFARFAVRPGASGSAAVSIACSVSDCAGNDLPTECADGAISVQARPGDCDGDGHLSVGEVQKAINMLLGAQPVGCGADCNGDGQVSIGEVQKVINVYLGAAQGC